MKALEKTSQVSCARGAPRAFRLVDIDRALGYVQGGAWGAGRVGWSWPAFQQRGGSGAAASRL